MSKSTVFVTFASVIALTGSAFADPKLENGAEFEVAFTYDHTLTAEQNLAEMEKLASAACMSVYRNTPTIYSTKHTLVKDCKADLIAKAVAQFDTPVLDAAYTGVGAPIESAMLD